LTNGKSTLADYGGDFKYLYKSEAIDKGHLNLRKSNKYYVLKYDNGIINNSYNS
jgi:hypothetical protein